MKRFSMHSLPWSLLKLELLIFSRFQLVDDQEPSCAFSQQMLAHILLNDQS
jgi:hypothetical protein